MEVLIVAATQAEVQPLKGVAPAEIPSTQAGSAIAAAQAEAAPLKAFKSTELLITGVGLPATIYQLTRALQKKRYDLVINAGIGGSLRPELVPGSVVEVQSDCFADLGAEDGDDFLDIFHLGLAGADSPPFKGGQLSNGFRLKELIAAGGAELPRVAGITVNSVHGEEARIARTRRLFPSAAIESMEGAGFFFVCMNEGQRCLQLRAISNFVERRQRENWNIPLAVQQLNATLANIIAYCQQR